MYLKKLSAMHDAAVQGLSMEEQQSSGTCEASVTACYFHKQVRQAR